MLLVVDSLHTNHSGPQQHARAFRGACFWHSSRVASPDEYTRGKWSAPQRSFRASQDAMCEKHDAQSPSAQAIPFVGRSSAAEQSRRSPQAAFAAAAVGTNCEEQFGVAAAGRSWNRRNKLRYGIVEVQPWFPSMEMDLSLIHI